MTIEITINEANEAIATITKVMNSLVPTPIANAIGEMTTVTQQILQAKMQEANGEFSGTDTIILPFNGLPYSQVALGMKQSHPFFFYGAIRKFFDFEA